MDTPRATMQFTGPLFMRDPAKTFVENVRRMMEGIAEEGEKAAVAMISASEGGRSPITAASPNRVSQHVRGRVKSLAGKPWTFWAVISVNPAGVSLGARISALARSQRGSNRRALNRLARLTGLNSRSAAISLMAAASEVERETHAFRTLTQQMRSSRAALRANLAEGLE